MWAYSLANRIFRKEWEWDAVIDKISADTVHRAVFLRISVGAQLTLGGQDIFAQKCMHEKLIKGAAKIMLCILKR